MILRKKIPEKRIPRKKISTTFFCHIFVFMEIYFFLKCAEMYGFFSFKSEYTFFCCSKIVEIVFVVRFRKFSERNVGDRNTFF